MPEEKDQSALEAHYSSLDRAWKEYKEHGSIEARDFIINAYTPLVESTARRIFQKKPWIFEFQDLKQAGMIGLVNAVERYDPSRGILFGTYAPRRIIGSIYDEINSMDWTPRAMRQKIRKTLLAVQKFENDGAEAPTPAQVAESAGIPGDNPRAWLAELGWPDPRLDDLDRVLRTYGSPAVSTGALARALRGAS